MRTVTRRIASAQRRRNERRRDVEKAGARQEAVDEEHPLELDELRRTIEATLASTRGRLGEVMRLRYHHGLKLREIAQRLDVPLGTIKADHTLGLQRMRKQLEDGHQDQRSWALLLVPFAAEGMRREPVVAGATVGVFAVCLVGLAGLIVSGQSVRRTATPTRRVTPLAVAPVEPALSYALSLAAADRPAAVMERVSLADASGDDALTAATGLLSAPVAAVASESSIVPAVEPSHARFSVLVTDGESPLGGVVVRAFGQGLGMLQEVVTDVDGLAQFDVVAAHLREPRVVGGAPTVLLSAFESSRAASHMLLLELADNAARGTIVKDLLALSVQGWVVDASGAPVPDATVFVDPGTFAPLPAGEGQWLLRRVEKQVTDANGHFLLERLAPGTRELVVEAPGYTSSVTSHTFATAGAHALAAPLELRRGAEVVGVALDPDGRPLADAKVWLESEERRPMRRVIRTEGDGSFHVRGVPPGHHTLWIVGGPPGKERSAQRTFDVEHDERITWNPTVASPGLGTLRLVAADGTPIAMGRLLVQTSSLARHFNDVVHPDESGTFHPARDPGEPVQISLCVMPRDEMAATMPIESWLTESPWEGELERVVEGFDDPRASLVGSVTDVDGAPFEHVELLLYSTQHRCSIRIPVAANGSFVAPGLSPGEYVLLATVPGRTPQSIGGITLEAGQVLDFGVLRFGAD